MVPGHVNTLIVGTQEDIDRTLVALDASFYPSRATWPIGRAIAPATTVLVPEVSGLSAQELRALSLLLDRYGSAVQVVSTSTCAIYDAVEAGAFPADLYYRLNVVVIGQPQSAPVANRPCHEHPTSVRAARRPITE